MTTNDQYIQDCVKTNTQQKNVVESDLLHSAIGIATESGELLDAIKKHLFYDKPLDRINLIEEYGDLLWYISIGLYHLDVSFEEVMTININKLRRRYPQQQFDSLQALNRNLEDERKVLEQ